MRWIGVALALYGGIFGAVSGTQTPTPYREPEIPKPSPAVQERLLMVRQRISEGKLDEGRKAADDALVLAQAEKDLLGQAEAQFERANSLEQSGNEDKVLTALLEAARLWEQAGYGPGCVRALVHAWDLLYSTDPRRADALFTRARTRGQAEGKWILTTADQLFAMGNLCQSHAQFEAAEQLYEDSLSLVQRAMPGTSRHIKGYLDVAHVAMMLGEYAKAGQYFQQARNLAEKLQNPPLQLPIVLANIAQYYGAQGDIESAVDTFEQSLRLARAVPPSVPNRDQTIAMLLSSLGSAMLDQGDNPRAGQYLEDSRAVFEHLGSKLTERPAAHALVLVYLAEVARRARKGEAAEREIARSIEITGQGPTRADMQAVFASSQYVLAKLAYDRGDIQKAVQLHEEALRLRSAVAPGTTALAAVRADLGFAYLLAGRYPEARDCFQKSVEMVEDRRRKIATLDTRVFFAELNRKVYAGLLQSHLALGDKAGAFHALERAHARSFLDRLAERDLDLSRFASPQLLQKQKTLDREFREAYSRHTRALIAHDDPARIAATAAVKKITQQQRQLEEEIRRHSPALAALAYPQPLTLSQAQKALDPGTLALAYSVNEQQTTLFALTRSSLTVVPLRRLHRQDLQRLVSAFRQSLQSPTSDYHPQAVALYHHLLLPVQSQIQASQRLLLCPEGPLQKLPFAALQPTRSSPFLIQSKPLHTILSLTAYAQLRMPPVAPAPARVVALGNPTYPRTPPSDPRLSAKLKTMGLDLLPLPSTQAQVQGIVRLYGKQGVALLADQATRQAVFAQASHARILHFACHGWADDTDPLGSALALTPDGEGDDGFLRAWEVLEKLRLHADLVTLCACETGLGVENKSEGILGLTRAFQLAGARRVLMSLWRIQDVSANALMLAFYRQVKAGASMDRALQNAQIALLKSKPFRHPHFWAPFVLCGYGVKG